MEEGGMWPHSSYQHVITTWSWKETHTISFYKLVRMSWLQHVRRCYSIKICFFGILKKVSNYSSVHIV